MKEHPTMYYLAKEVNLNAIRSHYLVANTFKLHRKKKKKAYFELIIHINSAKSRLRNSSHQVVHAHQYTNCKEMQRIRGYILKLILKVVSFLMT